MHEYRRDLRHIYRRPNQPVRAKVKRKAGDLWDVYRVTHPETGEIGWQAKKPAGYILTPYIGAVDPFADSSAGAVIFFAEGERDVETLAHLGLPAFAFGLIWMLKGEHVVRSHRKKQTSTGLM
ncbi:MAG: hypothetical protein JO108_10785 [Acidobacteriaceae bacterium]|nr:hypothetical protein [Acidobacteriaceae bacterium]